MKVLDIHTSGEYAWWPRVFGLEVSDTLWSMAMDGHMSWLNRAYSDMCQPLHILALRLDSTLREEIL